MSETADHVLDTIDGALAEYGAKDAMRWSPEPEQAVRPHIILTADQTRFAECDTYVLLRQIGRMNVLATSGGRVLPRPTGVTLPCGSGYSVDVDLEHGDAYTVRRVFTRAGRRCIKGERTGVYCEQVGETVYRAGCFRDEWT